MSHEIFNFKLQDLLTYHPKTQFDGIFASRSLFIFSRDQLGTIIGNFAKWLRPGGRLLIIFIDPQKCFGQQILDPLWETYWDTDGLCLQEVPWRCELKDARVTLFTRRGWEILLRQHGILTMMEGIARLEPGQPYDIEPHYFFSAWKSAT